MLTLKQIKAQLKKNVIKITRQYDSFSLRSSKIETTFEQYKIEYLAKWWQVEKENEKKYSWFRPKPEPSVILIRRAYDYNLNSVEDCISLEQASSCFCCAVYEFGSFIFFPHLNSYWKLLIQYYVQTSKKRFFLCTVLTQKKYAPLRKALKAVGFKVAGTEKGSHGRYTVEVWTYTKPSKKKKSKK